MSIYGNLFSSAKNLLNRGLEKTRDSFFSKLGKIGKSKIEEKFLEELEEVLISSDVGVKTSLKIIENIKNRAYLNLEDIQGILKEEVYFLLQAKEIPSIGQGVEGPYVIMIVGVNGVGKTTMTGKLAWKFKKSGLNVIIGATDTFRAAAIEQLKIWSDRADVPLIKQNMGSDPASVAFDTLKSAKYRKDDIVLIDTAGRLHNKVNLMNELSKIKRVMQKLIPKAPHDVLLVLDGTIGQNSFEQVRKFLSFTGVSSLAITKLDGSAKGGFIIGIFDEFKIPIKYLGIGEGISDLQPFDRDLFIESLFNKEY
ncbi:MAG TPA: signal recognition particle-docking protein FtsY [Candidatus Angelobacter sp.]|jgi:fused signal recognition particle receptor|nr:signal recognition particle-docking protein FtsY [Candidatus Angelobacter sp.]